jgi:hypothetical protein
LIFITLKKKSILQNNWVHGLFKITRKYKKKSMVCVSERTIPTEQSPLVGEVITNFFADRGCHVVSVTDPYGRILGFLDRSLYFSIKKLLSCIHEAEWTLFQTHNFFFSS